MGSCSSSLPSNNTATRPVCTVKVNVVPGSDWTKEQVLVWLKQINGGHFDQPKLLKSFKKNHINGSMLLELNQSQLKNKLKIKQCGLRLELIKFINRAKANVLIRNVSSSNNNNSIPSSYSLSRIINNNNDNNDNDSNSNTSSSHVSSHVSSDDDRDNNNNLNYNQLTNNKSINRILRSGRDRLSWTIGTIVLVYCSVYDCWTEATIEGILNPVEQWMYCGPCYSLQQVVVSYDVGNGYPERKTIIRKDINYIKSLPRYIVNRLKLNINCIVDVYDDSSHQWLSGYIVKVDKRSKSDKFTICLTSNPSVPIPDKIDRWSDKLRCSQTLLSLQANTPCKIFSWYNKKWCKSLICDIYNNPNQLNIYRIVYLNINDNKYYFKYIHEYSLNILPNIILNTYPDEYTDLTIATSKRDNNYKEDPRDNQYRNILITGYIRTHYYYSNNSSTTAIQLISLIMKQKYWIGECYALVMKLESIDHQLYIQTIYKSNR